MTHPGYTSPEIPSSYRDERQQELTTLTHPALARLSGGEKHTAGGV